MLNMDTLYKLMEQGWNINIECKAEGRVYGMTFEALAKKNISQNMTSEEIVQAFADQKHAVGDTLEEIVDRLAVQINKSGVSEL